MTYQQELAKILRRFSSRVSTSDISDPPAFDQAQAAINALNQETLGEDEPLSFSVESKANQNTVGKDTILHYPASNLESRKTRNKFRADLRKRFGL